MKINPSRFNVYSRLSIITSDKIPHIDTKIYINIKCNYAHFCVNTDDTSFITEIQRLDEPDDSFNELIVNKTSAKLGMDWDGDVVDAHMFILVRDDIIREMKEEETLLRKYGRLAPIVKWFKNIFRRNI